MAEEGEEVTLADLRTDCTAFLIPAYADEGDQQEILEHCYGLLFEEALAGWEDDENTWPAERDLKLFLSWFDVEFSSLAIDLVDAKSEKVVWRAVVEEFVFVAQAQLTANSRLGVDLGGVVEGRADCRGQGVVGLLGYVEAE